MRVRAKETTILLETSINSLCLIMAEEKDNQTSPAAESAARTNNAPAASGETACCGGGAGEGSPKSEPPACCAALPPGVEEEDLLESEALFAGFMKEANQPGLIDARAKKLIAIALAVATRCEPCLRLHLKAAIALGITKAEMDEAAWRGDEPGDPL